MIADMTAEATYAHPPGRVWRAVAHGDALGVWLMENDLAGEARPGASFCFRDRPRPFWDGVCPCQVVEAVPPTDTTAGSLVLRWNARDGAEGSRVAWTLTPTADGGTHLAFRHGELRGALGWIMSKGMAKGWQQMVARALPFVLDGLAQGALPTRAATSAARRG